MRRTIEAGRRPPLLVSRRSDRAARGGHAASTSWTQSGGTPASVVMPWRSTARMTSRAAR